MKECFGCKQIGHIKKKCRNGSGRKIGWKSEGSRANCHRAEVVVEGEEDVFDSGMNFLSLYTLNGGSRKHDPIMVGMKLNGKEVGMEVNTGAAVSVMSLSQYQGINGGRLRETKLQLRTYTGEVVRPAGVGEVHVNYRNQVMKLPVTVLDGKVPTLLGRDWLDKLKLDWAELFPVKIHKLEVDVRVEQMKAKYPEVFSGKLGCLKNFEVHIPIADDVQPIYVKPRSVPYVLKKRVDEELDVLEQQGVWKKVEYARWAAPIVPVLKDAKKTGGAI